MRPAELRGALVMEQSHSHSLPREPRWTLPAAFQSSFLAALLQSSLCSGKSASGRLLRVGSAETLRPPTLGLPAACSWVALQILRTGPGAV